MTNSNRVQKRKLIEVALPLEAINRESAREKSIRHGHPSTLHLWWARRPLAAARAVLFAQLVDDPSARPVEFPTEELQREERERLHKLIERLVVWENVRDEKLLDEVRAEIRKSTDGHPPRILDPFAGGGTIPLEAERLGLDAHASDLNPVAVLINKALIEIPPKFRDQPPVFPGLAGSQIRDWRGAEGLAADIRAYGTRLRDDARHQIGSLYPRATLADGSKASVIAWIWARTVVCPNPACGLWMPLVRSWWLERKKGKEAYVIPSVVHAPSEPSGLRADFQIGHDLARVPKRIDEGTVGRTGATCISCETSVPLAYIREQGRAKRMESRLIAVVAEGSRRRVYLPPSQEHEESAVIDPPADTIVGSLGYYPRDLKAPTYGLTEFVDLYTNRQLVALTTFSDLVTDVHKQVLTDGASSDYADAIATYMGLGISRAADRSSTIASWDASAAKIRNTFGRQAIPMTWDFAESSPFSESTGNYLSQIEWTAEAVLFAPRSGSGSVAQCDAATRSYEGFLVSTDPPFRKLSVCYGTVCCHGATHERSRLAPVLRQAA